MNIQLYWTKAAHVGTAGNELADEEAKRGGAEGGGGEITVAMPKAEIKNALATHMYKVCSTAAPTLTKLSIHSN